MLKPEARNTLQTDGQHKSLVDSCSVLMFLRYRHMTGAQRLPLQHIINQLLEVVFLHGQMQLTQLQRQQKFHTPRTLRLQDVVWKVMPIVFKRSLPFHISHILHNHLAKLLFTLFQVSHIFSNMVKISLSLAALVATVVSAVPCSQTSMQRNHFCELLKILPVEKNTSAPFHSIIFQ